jgi:hypothetical protein
MSDDKIKYLVTDDKGEFVIELPRDWKVTFANVNPAASGEPGYRKGGHCLRVWEAKDKLRAVFGNVTSVRDMSIPLARKVERQVGNSQWTMDSEGNFQGHRKVEVSHHLMDANGHVDDTVSFDT